MAAKIGILGESTSVTVGTYTVYTVPADKAARIRIMINMGGGGGTKQVAMQIGAISSETVYATVLTAEVEWWTGTRIDTGDAYPKNIVIHAANEGWSSTTTTTEKDLIAPLPIDYFLSTGDTVKYIASGATIGGLLFQVMGVEDDA